MHAATGHDSPVLDAGEPSRVSAPKQGETSYFGLPAWQMPPWHVMLLPAPQQSVVVVHASPSW